jgi:DUF971 family protein
MTAPEAIEIGGDGGDLFLRFAGAEEIALGAGLLRSSCKCAQCLRARIDGNFPDRFDDAAIVEAAPVGAFGLNLVFSDGHRRGIYPWPYLRELAAAPR